MNNDENVEFPEASDVAAVIEASFEEHFAGWLEDMSGEQVSAEFISTAKQFAHDWFSCGAVSILIDMFGPDLEGMDASWGFDDVSEGEDLDAALQNFAAIANTEEWVN